MLLQWLQRRHMPTKLEAQQLRHREREHVRKLVMAEARDKCHETRAAYVECAKGARRMPHARAPRPWPTL